MNVTDAKWIEQYFNPKDPKAVKPPKPGYVHPAEPTLAVDYTKEEKTVGQDSWKGFKEHNHMILIGPSNTGKTTWVITQLCEGWFDQYKKFCYVGPEVNKSQTKDIFLGAKSDLTLNSEADIEEENVFHYYYEIDKDMTTIEHMFRNKQSDKTLIFFDDVQATTFQQRLSSLLIQAKNSNITCIITIHDNQQTPLVKAARANCNYYVFFRPTDHILSTLTKTDSSKSIINRLAQMRREEQITIYDKLENTFYFATGKKLKIFGHRLESENDEKTDNNSSAPSNSNPSTSEPPTTK